MKLSEVVWVQAGFGNARRVMPFVLNGNIFTDINSLDLIDAADSLALVVLQFNTNKLLKLNQDILISDVIKEYNIDFDIINKLIYGLIFSFIFLWKR